MAPRIYSAAAHEVPGHEVSGTGRLAGLGRARAGKVEAQGRSDASGRSNVALR